MLYIMYVCLHASGFGSAITQPVLMIPHTSKIYLIWLRDQCDSQTQRQIHASILYMNQTLIDVYYHQDSIGRRSCVYSIHFMQSMFIILLCYNLDQCGVR